MLAHSFKNNPPMGSVSKFWILHFVFAGGFLAGQIHKLYIICGRRTVNVMKAVLNLIYFTLHISFNGCFVTYLSRSDLSIGTESNLYELIFFGLVWMIWCWVVWISSFDRSVCSILNYLTVCQSRPGEVGRVTSW